MSKPGEAPRSVSVTGEVYKRLEAEAERRGIAVSSLVEEALASVLGTTPPPARTFRKRRSRT